MLECVCVCVRIRNYVGVCVCVRYYVCVFELCWTEPKSAEQRAAQQPTTTDPSDHYYRHQPAQLEQPPQIYYYGLLSK